MNEKPSHRGAKGKVNQERLFPGCVPGAVQAKHEAPERLRLQSEARSHRKTQDLPANREAMGKPWALQIQARAKPLASELQSFRRSHELRSFRAFFVPSQVLGGLLAPVRIFGSVAGWQLVCLAALFLRRRGSLEWDSANASLKGVL